MQTNQFLNSYHSSLSNYHFVPIDNRESVESTPLSPFMSSDVLANNHCYVDGSRIERETSFTYSVPIMTTDHIRECVQKAIEANIFPNVMPPT